MPTGGEKVAEGRRHLDYGGKRGFLREPPRTWGESVGDHGSTPARSWSSLRLLEWQAVQCHLKCVLKWNGFILPESGHKTMKGPPPLTGYSISMGQKSSYQSCRLRDAWRNFRHVPTRFGFHRKSYQNPPGINLIRDRVRYTIKTRKGSNR